MSVGTALVRLARRPAGGDDPAERAGAVERPRDVAVVDTPQDRVGEVALFPPVTGG